MVPPAPGRFSTISGCPLANLRKAVREIARERVGRTARADRHQQPNRAIRPLCRGLGEGGESGECGKSERNEPQGAAMHENSEWHGNPPQRRDHLVLRPSVAISFSIVFTSSATILVISSGVLLAIKLPLSVSRWIRSGERAALTNSSFNFATMAFGVAAGASRPRQSPTVYCAKPHFAQGWNIRQSRQAGGGIDRKSARSCLASI